jgi:hypothetical protein
MYFQNHDFTYAFGLELRLIGLSECRQAFFVVTFKISN